MAKATSAKVQPMGNLTNTSDTVYPLHAADSGPLLPTGTGGLICAKCYEQINSPDFGVLRQARAAHKAAGCEPLNMSRPKPERPSDLTDSERRGLLSVAKGRGRMIRPETAAPLVVLGLISEKVEHDLQGRRFVRDRSTTPDGARIANLCEEATRKIDTERMFDLGEPDPAAVRRMAEREEAAKRKARARRS